MKILIKKQINITAVSTLALFLQIFVHSLSAQSYNEPSTVLIDFKHPQYGEHSSDVPEMMIYGQKATSAGILIHLEGLKIEWFDNAIDKIKATISTPSGVFNKSNKTIVGNEEIKFNSDAMTVEGIGFEADSEKKIIRVLSNVKVVLKRDLEPTSKNEANTNSEQKKDNGE